MSGLAFRYLAAVVTATVVLLILRFARGFFWSHALIVGLAAGALVFSAWRTFDRWRS